MRVITASSAQPVLAAALALLFTATIPRLASAGPLVDIDANDELGVAYDFLLQRATCDGTLCGYDQQLCCSAGSACYTDANTQAQCSATAAAAGGWAYYTTVYTQTDLQTITSVWSSYTATATTPVATTVACQASLGESACGAICCASSQYCYQSGQCMAYGSSSYSNAVRPTSGASTATSTVKVTTTQPFSAPATASNTLIAESSGGSHLSGGAIAGIVIGTLAGIALLVAICFCCILRAGCDALLGIFGLGKGRKRRSTERVEVVEERYSRHGSTAAGRSTHGGWFGAGRRPSRTTETKTKKSGGLGGLGAVGAGLAGLALILGLKRRQDRMDEKSRASRAGTSRYSYSDYTYTDSYTGTSESSVSSDRRTRETRRTERSRRP